jgi:uncharacterized LabA/DUF88 family protein
VQKYEREMILPMRHGPSDTRPMPNFRRMMIFADGENLSLRYKSMLKKGYEPHENMVHIPDVLVWSSWCSGLIGLHEVIRANYYTSAVGDENFIDSIKERIKKTKYEKHRDSPLPNWLTPIVFKKSKKSVSCKGVDIQICVDVLTHVYRDNVDSVLILSGDGDYVPLIKAVLQAGKQVYLAAFSDGLNKNLTYIADEFYCLDHHVFINSPK